MENNIPDISIVIVNYNTFHLTCDCIKSIIEKTKSIKFEIILVDNNSNECDPKNFKLKFPQIRLIENKENVGFGIANNQGMLKSKADYILLLNSDTYLLNDAIDIAHNYAIENRNMDIFGATLLNEDLSSQISYYHNSEESIISAFKISFIYSNPLLNKVLNPSKSKSNNKIGGLYGAYILLKREVFEKTGGFDSDFFMYCEDTEWFRNRLNKRFNIGICKNAKIVHYSSKSSKGINLINKQNILSYYLYWYKISKTYFLIYLLGSYINSIITIFLLPLMSKIERLRHFKLTKFRFQLLPVILSILLYSNKKGGRKKSLKI